MKVRKLWASNNVLQVGGQVLQLYFKKYHGDEQAVYVFTREELEEFYNRIEKQGAWTLPFDDFMKAHECE